MYKSKTAKFDAWKEIAAKLDISVAECEAKWKSVTSQYVREKKKEETKVTGKGRKDAYVSKWYLYNSLKFFHNSRTIAPTISSSDSVNDLVNNSGDRADNNVNAAEDESQSQTTGADEVSNEYSLTELDEYSSKDPRELLFQM
jgi:hypothetical protein